MAAGLWLCKYENASVDAVVAMAEDKDEEPEDGVIMSAMLASSILKNTGCSRIFDQFLTVFCAKFFL
jgi:hypothetical protein